MAEYIEREAFLDAIERGKKYQQDADDIEFYPYPTACGYRCWDGKEWRDCDKHGRPYERK